MIFSITFSRTISSLFLRDFRHVFSSSLLCHPRPLRELRPFNRLASSRYVCPRFGHCLYHLFHVPLRHGLRRYLFQFGKVSIRFHINTHKKEPSGKVIICQCLSFILVFILQPPIDSFPTLKGVLRIYPLTTFRPRSRTLKGFPSGQKSLRLPRGNVSQCKPGKSHAKPARPGRLSISRCTTHKGF